MIPKTIDEFKQFLLKTQYIVSELTDEQYELLKLSLQQGRNIKNVPNKNEILQSRLNEINSSIELEKEDYVVVPDIPEEEEIEQIQKDNA